MRLRSWIFTVLVTFAALSCGHSDPVQQSEVGPFSEVACPAFALAATQGVTLDEIDIGEVPASFELPVAAALTLGDDDEPSDLAFIRSDDEGALYLVVPLHPVTPSTGGPVTLTVTDGTQACAPVSFTILPMPEADGELAAVVDLLQAILAEQAASFDVTPEDLLAEPIDDLPPGLWPLAVAQTLLDDPAADFSLRAAANGDLGAEARDWLDRMTAQLGIRDELEAAVTASPTEASAPTGASPPAPVSALTCLPDIILDSAQLLDECMEAATHAEFSANGISRKVADDIKNAFAEAGKRGVLLADVVAEAFGIASWIIYSQREKAAALYPSQFTDMSVLVSKERFYQDEEGQGRVNAATVYATNDGYNLQDEIVEGVKQGISLAENHGKFDFTTGTDADQIAGRVQGRIRTIVEQRLRESSIEELDISAELFGPVDVTDPMWIDARVAAGVSIEVDEETTVYTPKSEGSSTLSVRTEDGKFGGHQITASAEVVVTPVAISISPSEIFVAPTDPENIQLVTFTVLVQEAAFPDRVDLDLSEHPQQGSAEIRISQKGNTHFVDYLAPEHPDFDQTDLIVVVDTATTGALANDPQPSATATIHFGSITVTPRAGCVELSDTVTFSPDVLGPTDTPIEWTATAGNIDDNGHYTAPATTPPGGVATIRATSTQYPELYDEVTIPIGCTCSSSVTLNGNTVFAAPGDQVFFSDLGGAEQPNGTNFFGIFFQQAGGPLVSAVPFGTNTVGWPEAGTGYPVSVSGTVAVTPDQVVYSSGAVEGAATLDLDAYVPEASAEGSVQAQVTILKTDNSSLAGTLTWDFAVQVPVGYERGSETAGYGYIFACTVPGA